MRVAIVSDQLFVYGGAERVVEQILAVFPDADLHALVDFVPKGQREFLGGRKVATTYIQNMPGAARHFRKYFHLWPKAIETIELAGYDLVISSHHSVAHGVLTGPNQVHVCYTHSPMRYAWDQRSLYTGGTGLDRGLKGWWVRHVLHRARQWDTLAGQRPDAFVANSSFVRERIHKFYRRSASVIHPPVDVERMPFQTVKDGPFVSAGRLVGYKRFDLVIEAFRRMPARRLVVAGDGESIEALRKNAPENVSFTGWTQEPALRRLIADARAFVFAGVEDFGIMPIEAQASGTPVIALRRGGLAETVIDLEDGRAPTSVLFDEQSADAIVDAVETFERNRSAFTPEACADNARRFAPARFKEAFSGFCADALAHRASTAAHEPRGVACDRAS